MHSSKLLKTAIGNESKSQKEVYYFKKTRVVMLAPDFDLTTDEGGGKEVY